MFGLGIREIIMTALVVVVWYGFKMINLDTPPKKKPGVGEKVAGGVDPGAVEMQVCRVCNVYVMPGSPDCGTAQCPYPKR